MNGMEKPISMALPSTHKNDNLWMNNFMENQSVMIIYECHHLHKYDHNYVFFIVYVILLCT